MQSKLNKNESNDILVSWCIPTTLYKHRWWKRLAEFLQEDFPAENIECIFLCTQDKGFEEKAVKIGKKVKDSLFFVKGVEKRWQNVRFVEKSEKHFNLSRSRNILTDLARGDIIIARDADCATIQYGLSKFMVRNLVDYRLGLLSVPSLKNGFHFKPKNEYRQIRHPKYQGVTLTASANGMATASLKSVEKLMGGRNGALDRWGEHTALNTKLSQAGFVQAYADQQGYWLVSSDEESSITLTNEFKDSRVLLNKEIGIGLMNKYYKVKKKDTFWHVQKVYYGVDGGKLSHEAKYEVERRFSKFSKFQNLEDEYRKFDFQPWGCLDDKETIRYLENAWVNANKFYSLVEGNIRKLNLAEYIFKTKT